MELPCYSTWYLKIKAQLLIEGKRQTNLLTVEVKSDIIPDIEVIEAVIKRLRLPKL